LVKKVVIKLHIGDMDR